MNHMKSAHKQMEQDSSTPSEEQVHMHTDTGTITKVLSKTKSFYGPRTKFGTRIQGNWWSNTLLGYDPVDTSRS